MSNATTVWRKQLTKILQLGDYVEPRGLDTLELVGSQIAFDMKRPVVQDPKRALNYGFMGAEALWILLGDNRLQPINEVMKAYAQFSDDGLFMAGAYGPKIIDQIPYVIKTLGKDRYSRQAVINIWRERPYDSKDIPCTLSMQFLIRNNQFNSIVTMRSSDAWLGLPYDMFTFSMTAELIRRAAFKECDLGICHLTMGSSHLYGINQDRAADVLKVTPPDIEDWKLDPDKCLFDQLSYMKRYGL